MKPVSRANIPSAFFSPGAPSVPPPRGPHPKKTGFSLIEGNVLEILMIYVRISHDFNASRRNVFLSGRCRISFNFAITIILKEPTNFARNFAANGPRPSLSHSSSFENTECTWDVRMMRSEFKRSNLRGEFLPRDIVTIFSFGPRGAGIRRLTGRQKI